jgi:hypothetical protein
MNDSNYVAAKTEYTIQLCELLLDPIKQGFISVWESCINDPTALKTFQEKLCMIPKWNSDIIDEEYLKVTTTVDPKCLEKLIEAVFLSNIKILSVIRVNKEKNINVKIPEPKNFIHKCYVETARKLWSDPYLIDTREEKLNYVEIKRNLKRLDLCINDSIEKTVSKLIPIQDILENYLQDIEDDTEDEKDSDDSNDANTEGAEGAEGDTGGAYAGGDEGVTVDIPHVQEGNTDVDTGCVEGDIFTTDPGTIDLPDTPEPPHLNIEPKNVTISSSKNDNNDPFFTDSDEE